MNWTQRMREAQRRTAAAANSAGSADSFGPGGTQTTIGTTGTIGAAHTTTAMGVGRSECRPIDTIGTIGTAAIITADDPGSPIAAYRERLAICLDAGDVPEAEAHRIATSEAGADLTVLSARQVAWWQACLAAWCPAETKLQQLQCDLGAIAREPWVVDAARAGWSDTAVFGAHPVAPLVRIECWGLAVHLTLSPHNRAGKRVRVVSLDSALARIETPTGARFGVEPTNVAYDHAVPVWAISNETSAAASLPERANA